MKTIILKDATSALGSGACGTYFRISRRRGVKIYDGSRADRKDKLWFGYVERDFKLMRKMACALIPKAYALVAVKVPVTPIDCEEENVLEAGWYTGILMEHIDGRSLADIRGYRSHATEVIAQSLGKRIEKQTGYVHADLHAYNILYCKRSRRYRAIDIEAGWIE